MLSSNRTTAAAFSSVPSHPTLHSNDHQHRLLAIDRQKNITAPDSTSSYTNDNFKREKVLMVESNQSIKSSKAQHREQTEAADMTPVSLEGVTVDKQNHERWLLEAEQIISSGGS